MKNLLNYMKFSSNKSSNSLFLNFTIHLWKFSKAFDISIKERTNERKDINIPQGHLIRMLYTCFPSKPLHVVYDAKRSRDKGTIQRSLCVANIYSSKYILCGKLFWNIQKGIKSF